MPAAPRFFCPAQLLTGATINLPSNAARHVQVLRLQPGNTITLFGAASSAHGGEFEATIADIGRHEVRVVVGSHHPVEREPAREIHLAIGMPANERMDWLVEKATELGVTIIQPLMTERCVVRLDEARARKKTAHWNSIAIAACEQCGRNRVPSVFDVMAMPAWGRQLDGTGVVGGTRLVLSLRPHARPLRQTIGDRLLPDGPVTVLSGPEGGLSTGEEELAITLGFAPVSLGARVLRSETAALVALTLLA